MEKASNYIGDMELFLNTIENYLDTPYIWGVYKLLILPSTFPYGGMENPELTFTEIFMLESP